MDKGRPQIAVIVVSPREGLFDGRADPQVIRCLGQGDLRGLDGRRRAMPLDAEARQAIERFCPGLSRGRCFHKSLEQVLDFLARVRPPNSLNLLSYRPAPGAIVVGEPLPSLPPSVSAILRDRGPGEASTPELSYVRLQSETLEQPVPVTGSVRLHIDVVPKIW